MTLVNTVTKYIDTHLRVNTDLRTSLKNMQELYNTHKHKETPHRSINALCNIAIIILDDYLGVCNEEEGAMALLTNLAEKYATLQAKTEFVYEFHEGDDSHE